MSIHADAQSGFRHTFLPPPVVIPSLYSVAVFSSWRSPSVRASTSPPLPRVFSTPKRPTSNPLGRFSPRRFFHVLALYVRLASRQKCVDAALNAALLLFSFFPPLDPAGMLLFIPSLAAPHASPQLGLRLRHGAKAIRRCRGRETIIGGGVTAMAGDAAGNAETSGGGRARR